MKFKATVIFDAKNAPAILEAADKVISQIEKVYTEDKAAGTVRKRHWRHRKNIEAAVKERLSENTNRLVQRKGKWWRSTSEAIMTKVLADGKIHHTSELIQACTKEGYNKNSTSPRLSDMVKQGKVEMLGDGNYRLANATQG